MVLFKFRLWIANFKGRQAPLGDAHGRASALHGSLAWFCVLT